MIRETDFYIDVKFKKYKASQSSQSEIKFQYNKWFKIEIIILWSSFNKLSSLNIVCLRSDAVAVQLSRYTDIDVELYFKERVFMCNNQTLYVHKLFFLFS